MRKGIIRLFISIKDIILVNSAPIWKDPVIWNGKKTFILVWKHLATRKHWRAGIGLWREHLVIRRRRGRARVVRRNPQVLGRHDILGGWGHVPLMSHILGWNHVMMRWYHILMRGYHILMRWQHILVRGNHIIMWWNRVNWWINRLVLCWLRSRRRCWWYRWSHRTRWMIHITAIYRRNRMRRVNRSRHVILIGL